MMDENRSGFNKINNFYCSVKDALQQNFLFSFFTVLLECDEEFSDLAWYPSLDQC